jgi:hypothetical protein
MWNVADINLISFQFSYIRFLGPTVVGILKQQIF